MRLAALAALFALTCLGMAAVGTRAYSDTPKSPVPNGNESDGNPDEAPRPGKPRPQREPIYNPKADAKADIDHGLKTAGEENKRVLIAFGGNWCEWCFKLDDVLTKNVELAPIVKKGFVLVLVDANSNR